MFHDAPTKDTRLVPGLDLRVLAAFEADVDEVLSPGDMLYLPPGFAHRGVAVTPCLPYSVGFRAPSAGEAWIAFVSSLAKRPDAASSTDLTIAYFERRRLPLPFASWVHITSPVALGGTLHLELRPHPRAAIGGYRWTQTLAEVLYEPNGDRSCQSGDGGGGTQR
jgi:hypothetical protein